MSNIKASYVMVEALRLHEISVTMPFEAICSVPLKPFSGTVTITYLPKSDLGRGKVRLLEWDSLAESIRENRDIMITAEGYASLILDVVEETTQSEDIFVEVCVTSGYHLPVTVSAVTGYDDL